MGRVSGIIGTDARRPARGATRPEPRVRPSVVLAGVALLAAAAVAARRARPSAVRPDEGLIVGIPAVYDRLASWFLAPFHAAVADAVVAAVPAGAAILDVGCGPGHLLARLAARGRPATGVDVDPGMVARARARLGDGADVHVGDAAALPVPDAAFDLVVSTLAMHHWPDPAAGLAEIARVLRPDGRAIVWDLAPGVLPFHTRFAGPAHHVPGSPLRIVAAPGPGLPARGRIVQRVELRHAGAFAAGTP